LGVSCGRLSWLMSALAWSYVNTAFRIVGFRLAGPNAIPLIEARFRNIFFRFQRALCPFVWRIQPSGHRLAAAQRTHCQQHGGWRQRCRAIITNTAAAAADKSGGISDVTQSDPVRSNQAAARFDLQLPQQPIHVALMIGRMQIGIFADVIVIFVAGIAGVCCVAGKCV